MTQGLNLTLSSISYIRNNNFGKIYRYCILIGLVLSAFFLIMIIWGSMGVKSLLASLAIASTLTAIPLVGAFLSFLIMIWLYTLIAAPIILVAMGPILSRVAQRTIEVESGSKPEEQKFFHNLGRTILVVLVNLSIQLFILFLLTLMGWFMPIKIITFILTLCVNAYFYASSMADYTLELLGMSTIESLRYGRRNIRRFVGLGLIFATLMVIPFVGPFIALMLAPATTAACARSYFLESHK